MKIVFVFAHPDDETFGCGGTIAKVVKEGHEVRLLSATRGEAGLFGKRTDIVRADLALVREGELRRAAQILGVDSVEFLGFHDGTLAAFDPQKGKEAVIRVLAHLKPDIVVTFGPDGITWHEDHIAIGKFTTAAYKELVQKQVLSPGAALYYCALPKEYRADGGVRAGHKEVVVLARNDTSTVVDIRKVADIKQRAARMHETQIQDLERAMLQERFSQEEFFHRIVPPWPAGNPQEHSLYPDISA